VKNIKRNILLNPGPATTTDSVKYAQVVPDICPREKEFVEIMKTIREDLVRVVHGSKEYTAVLFCGSGTIAMDVCLNSLLPEGKKILIVNNGAYSQRAVEICKYYNLEHIDLKFSETKVPNIYLIEETLKNEKNISMVYTTHNETGTGLLNPIKEIGALAHKYNSIFVVDTTSSYAMKPIDIEEENIDFCMASAQKGLMGMTGISYVIGKKRLIEASQNYPKRSYYCNLYMQYDYFEKYGEMHFTPPVQTIYALKQALKEYFAEGELNKWERHKDVFTTLYQGIQKLGFECLFEEKYMAGLVIAVKYPKHKEWDFQKIHDYCYEHGYTIYPGKINNMETFRLCALGAITKEDATSFLVTFEQGLKSLGITLKGK